jgi:hypothetical protein
MDRFMKIILNEDAKSFLECIAVDIKHAMDVIYRMELCGSRNFISVLFSVFVGWN